jgi:PAS domain S-box-containing protein
MIKKTILPKDMLRQQAEAKLSKSKKGRTTVLANERAADAQRLVHELQVHQIELEMQNEELIRTRAAAETAFQQYADLYDFAPAGYFTLGRDGAIRKINFAGARLLGMERSNLLNRRFGVFVSSRSQTVFNAFLEKVFSAGGKNETCEIELLKDQSESFWAHIEAASSASEMCRAIVSDVTEHKQTEESLRASEARLLEAQSVAKVGSWETDLSTLKVIWSAQTYMIFDLDPNTFQASHPAFLDFVHPEDRAKVDAAFLTSFDSSIYNTIEHRIVTAKGVTKYVEERWRIFRNNHEQPTRAVGTCQDITERKQVEEMLIESDAKYKALFENISEAVFIYNPDSFEILYANESTSKLYGYDKDELIGMSCLKFSAEIDKSKTVAAQIIKDGQATVPSRHHKKKDGSDLYVQLSGYKVTVNGRDIMFTVCRDITEQKRAEERIEFLAKFPSENPNPILRIAADGVLLYVNEAGLKLQMNLQVGQPAPPVLRKSALQTIQGGTPQTFELELDRRVHSFFVAPVAAAGYVNLYASDITERRYIEDEIRQLNASLERRVEERTRELLDAQEQLIRQGKLAVLGQLAGSVGHELRNPLTVISNAAYYLKTAQPDASDKVKEHLELIEKHTRISAKIVSDLLDLTRIKSAEHESIPVSRLAHQALERFPAPESVRVTLDIPADLPKVYADPQHIVQILGNLALNAYQSMPEGGKLAISSHAQGDMVCIAVQDTGSGITPENMRKIFEPLFTTKPKGIGLGLAVCRNLIEANGGRIEVQSETGVGSTFSVYLPVYESSRQRL